MSLNSESARVRAAEIQALESAITAGIEAIGGGRVTAFPVEEGDLAVVVEVEAELLGLLNPDLLAKLVEDAARREGGAAPRWITLLELGQLPPTADGDARRSHCASRFVQGSLGALAVYRDGVRQDDGADSSCTQELASETERQLAEIWRAVLGVEPSRKVSFFALGGSSLLAAQLVTRVSERFRVMLDVRVLFEAPTLKGMALAIDAALAQPVAEQLLEPIAPLRSRCRSRRSRRACAFCGSSTRTEPHTP
jgi:acyl carrier protein